MSAAYINLSTILNQMVSKDCKLCKINYLSNDHNDDHFSWSKSCAGGDCTLFLISTQDNGEKSKKLN